MRAMVCHRLSPSREGLVFEANWPEPLPPEVGEITVAISHAALNYPDLLMLSGGYQFAPSLPFVPGVEGVGVVIAIGFGVDPSMLNRDVIVSARCGLFAERITVAIDAVRRRPVGLSPPAAAAFTVAALTAYVALVRRGCLASGDRVLVVGAGGGTGLAAIAMAKALGATVVAMASTAAKVGAALAAGADEVHVVPRGASLPMIETVDIIFDPVGGSAVADLLALLGHGGRYLVVGFVGGIPSLSFGAIAGSSVEVIGVRAGEYARRDPTGGLANLAAIDDLAPALEPQIGLTVALADADIAFDAMAAGTLIGKAVIVCG